MTEACVLALDAGGTFFKSALVTPDGKSPDGTFRATPVDSKGDRDAVIAVYRTVFAAAFSAAKARNLRIAGVGVSTPGPFDYAAGVSRMTHKFQAIHGLSLRELFAKECGVAAGTPVCFLHDAWAFLAGELWQGRARGAKTAAGVTLGTGLGFSMFRDGTPWLREDGGPRVSLYNRPCGEGVLEDYVSGRGLIREYARASGRTEPGVDAREIARRARDNGDAAARRVFRDAGRRLGEALTPVFQELPAERMVVGGQIAKSFDLMEPGVRDGVAAAVCPEMSAAEHLDDATLFGAARYAFLGGDNAACA